MEKIMSIVKFEINLSEAVTTIKKFKENRLKALEELAEDVRSSVSGVVNELLNAEMGIYLGEPDQANNKRNGHKERRYAIKGIGAISIKYPQARKAGFESAIIPKGERIDPRIKEDMAVLELAGLSTRTMSMMSKRLLGIEVSNKTVAQSLDLISDRALSWLTRPITEHYWALYIDGTNFNIQRRGSTQKEPSLVVLGIDENDYRSVLAIEPGYKDSADAWRTVLKGLKERGLDPLSVRIGIMDGLPGLERVFAEEFPKAVTARCWVHAMKNALNKAPTRLRTAFKMLASKVMNANSLDDAKAKFDALKAEMGHDAKRAINCLEKDLDSLLAHYSFDKSYWKTLRTTNPIERVNKEFKRRTKSMETLGERTLEILVAFTALKMELGWKRNKVNARVFDNLPHLKGENAVEVTIDNLLH